MKNVNKILILFMFGVCILFYATWEALQSRWMAEQVSKISTRYIREVLNADVEFNNLKLLRPLMLV